MTSAFARRFAGLLCGFAFAAMASAPVAAVPVLSGETLKVEFGFASPPDIGIALPPGHPLGIADVLAGWLNVTPGGGPLSATFALYDGTTLLGSYALNFGGFTNFGFSAPGGLYTHRTGTASDFSSIADGTIDGILLITNTGPAALNMDVLLLEAGHGADSNGYHVFTPEAVIRSQTLFVAVPEPAAMTLLLGGVLAAGFARLKRRKHGAPMR